MKDKFFLKNKHGYPMAIFEIDKPQNKAIVSAILGAATMMYLSEMTIDKARELYKKFMDERDMRKCSEAEAKNFSHRSVWDFYR